MNLHFSQAVNMHHSLEALSLSSPLPKGEGRVRVLLDFILFRGFIPLTLALGNCSRHCSTSCIHAPRQGFRGIAVVSHEGRGNKTVSMLGGTP